MIGAPHPPSPLAIAQPPIMAPAPQQSPAIPIDEASCNGNMSIQVHTCGSLFAKCSCASTTTTAANRQSVVGSAPTTPDHLGHQQQRVERRKTLFQSYSHPDTNFVFTDENRNPLRPAAADSAASHPTPASSTSPQATASRLATVAVRLPRGQSTVTRTKRISTPCAPGTYSVLDVAVHPDLMLARSHENGRIEPISADVVAMPRLPRASTARKESGTGRAAVLERQIGGLSVAAAAEAAADAERTRNNLEYLKYSAIGHQRIEAQQLARKVAEERASRLAEEDDCGSSGNEERRDSFCAMEAVGSYNRRASRSLGDPQRVEQLRQYAMRKQSECNETDYLRAHRQRTAELEAETGRLRQTISDRDNEIHKLKREIHKLKSVLQQTAQPTSPEGDLLASLQTHHHMPGQQSFALRALHSSSNSNLAAIQQSAASNGHSQHDPTHSSSSSSASTSTSTADATPSSHNGTDRPATSAIHPAVAALKPPVPVPLQHTLSLPTTAVKKQGVSGESSDTNAHQQSRDILIPKYDKDFRSKQLIKEAIMDNDFLKNLDSSQVRELVDSMYALEVRCGEYVIREGEAGAHLFVSAVGEFEVIQAGTVLGRMGEGKAFGELAILYNCTRTASIKVVADARLWVLDRRIFQAIMMRTGLQRIEENISFLRSVPLLQNLSKPLLAKIADVLEVEFYPAGTYVIRQGASGATFFLISQGTVKVTQRLRDGQPNEEEEIRTLNRGDYFGEQALIKEDKRTANIIAMAPGVECLTLDRESFRQLIGDLCELREKDYGDESRVLAMKRSESKVRLFGAETPLVQEHLDIELDDLDVVATLGVGGFGRVELVKHAKLAAASEVRSFALKCLKKQHIVDTRQEEHVFSERTIMLACRSPFICRLYRTYRDSKYVYMLLEACMGGEVWTILRDRGYFDDATAQFVIGSVLQAFEYLHQLGIVYRDLKPENLMLDDRGYVKLVDFGFSKCIGYSGKTWTFCGTPEYVAPEIILNKGHDRAVDYWALGILIHELLTGSPPFNGSDPMKTYNIILKGIDMVDFPKHMSRSAVQLIKKLCRDIPAERLGYQRSGTQDIKNHKWFQNFDWDGLANQTMEPPILQPVQGPLDTCNFDDFPMDMEEPPDELSGWDKGF